MRTLGVVCPVYNEAEVIGDFHAALRAVLTSQEDRYAWTVTYVLDRGVDDSLEILKGLAATEPRVRILALSSRFGHQASLVAGIDHCDADAVVMLDSDLQHPPELIPELLAAFERGHDIVFTVREDAPQIGWFKRVSSRLFYRLINLVSAIPIHESAADYRLISRKVAAVFRTQLRERNQFLRGLFAWVGFRHTSVNFRVRPRGGGTSKYSLRRMVRFGLSGITSFSKRPLQAAVILGFVFAILGLLLGLVTLLQYLLSAQLPSGWTTIIMLITGFNGVQLIFLGVLGEYLGAIFDEVKGRPLYILDETVNLPPDPRVLSAATSSGSRTS